MRRRNMQKPNLEARENENLLELLAELGLEMKPLNYLTKQNLSKPVKPLDTNT